MVLQMQKCHLAALVVLGMHLLLELVVEKDY